MTAVDQRLVGELMRGQRHGFIGPGQVEAHVRHARAHGTVAGLEAGQLWCDLGSGGGVPGLVIALDQPGVKFVLLDRAERRIEFLEEAVERLCLRDRVGVVLGDAAELAHHPEHRHAYDGIVSRAFGPPSAVSECSAGLLRTGGRLVVSEPPGSDHSRWPAAALTELGLAFAGFEGSAPRFAVIVSQSAPTSTYPRGWKQIRKRPLF